MTTIETCLVCRTEFVATSPPEHCCSERCWQTAVEYARAHRGFNSAHFKKPRPTGGWKPGRPRRQRQAADPLPVM